MSEVTHELAQATLSKGACERRRRKQATIQLLRGGAIACFFLCIMLLMAMLHLNRLPVREIVFEGNVHYSENALLQIFPQKVGDALHLVNRESIRETMLAECAYLSDVSVEVSLRGVVKVTVREREALWALRYNADEDTVGYALLDAELRALEYVQGSMSACVVICPGIALPRVGETLAQAAVRHENAYIENMISQGMDEDDIQAPPYRQAEQELAERLLTLSRAFSEAQTLDAPAAIDFSAAYDYTLTLQNGSMLLLGNALQLETQIAYAAQAMANYRSSQGFLSTGQALMVDVRDLSRVFVREISPQP